MTLDRICLELRHGALAAGLFVALVAPAAPGAQGTGTIGGTVTTRATMPAPIRVTTDQGVCGRELPDEAVVTDAEGHLANAVVTVAGVKARQAPAAGNVLNERCRFAPRVQIVRPNATLATSSRDPILHTTNAQSERGRTIFNVAVPMPGVTITRAVNGAGLLRLGCNTHPWMRGWVWVTDEIAAVTGPDGRFTLRDVPPGTYELRVWHESLQSAPQRVTVRAGETSTIAFEAR